MYNESNKILDWIPGVLALVGNGMVLYIFGKTAGLRTPANLLVMNLAFSDFMLMATLVPEFVTNCVMVSYQVSIHPYMLLYTTPRLINCQRIFQIRSYSYREAFGNSEIWHVPSTHSVVSNWFLGCSWTTASISKYIWSQSLLIALRTR